MTSFPKRLSDFDFPKLKMNCSYIIRPPDGRVARVQYVLRKSLCYTYKSKDFSRFDKLFLSPGSSCRGSSIHLYSNFVSGYPPDVWVCGNQSSKATTVLKAKERNSTLQILLSEYLRRSPFIDGVITADYGKGKSVFEFMTSVRSCFGT